MISLFKTVMVQFSYTDNASLFLRAKWFVNKSNKDEKR